MLHSLVFFGIVVYFLPGGWTSAQNQDARVKLPPKSMSILPSSCEDGHESSTQDHRQRPWIMVSKLRIWLVVARDGPDHKCGTTETAAPLGISHSNKEGKKTDFLPLWNEMAQPDSTRREGPQSDPRA
jgi:hypothetical protein